MIIFGFVNLLQLILYSFLGYGWMLIQVIIGAGLWFPAILWCIGLIRNNNKDRINTKTSNQYDFAIIVTAYQQTDFLSDVVNAILKMNYQNYMIYIVADNCDITHLVFNNKKVVVLKPETILANNIKSHLYAIERFERTHEIITIIDSDNIVHPEYLNGLSVFFKKGYKAVQGIRAARNLNTEYACLDEAGDMYYRMVDRKLTFGSGSSATLAGSGMAFSSDLYKQALQRLNISGAGFDKLLQFYLVNNGERLAFAEDAIVYDGKTSKSDQLVKQRARWISAWAKSWASGWKLLMDGILQLNWNKAAFSIVLLRPPLFILFFLSAICILIDFFIQPGMILFWLIAVLLFLVSFFGALVYFKASKNIYYALLQAPKFIYYQVLALLKAKKANEISVATKHEI